MVSHTRASKISEQHPKIARMVKIIRAGSGLSTSPTSTGFVSKTNHPLDDVRDVQPRICSYIDQRLLEPTCIPPRRTLSGYVGSTSTQGARAPCERRLLGPAAGSFERSPVQGRGLCHMPCQPQHTYAYRWSDVSNDHW